MNKQQLSAPLILCGAVLTGGPLLLALQPRADQVGFAPGDGSSVAKQFDVRFDLALGDLTMMVDGQDMSGAVPADFEVSSELSMSVVDTYVDVEAGVPLELVRLYDAMEAVWQTPDDSGEADDGTFAELPGKSVRFKWNPDAETYELSYVDEEGDEDALDGLSVDMDFRSMLPEDGLGGELSEGDTWALDGNQVVAMLFFGTDLSELDELDVGEDDMGMAELFEAELLPQLKTLFGELGAQCTYRGSREQDGRRLGEVAVAVEGQGDIDLSAVILGVIEAQGEGVELDVAIDEAIVSLELTGEGTLLWDLEAGRFHSFELSPALEVLVDVVLSVDVMGESHDAEVSVELLGDGAWSASAAAK